MKESPVVANTWAALRRLTPARIALGRAGSGLPTAELLRFGLAHARARDAVHAALDAEALARRLAELGLSPTIVKSAAMNRETYLRRPDLGRRLAPDADISKSDHPFALVIADGLSALAVERHAVPLVRALIALSPQRWAGASCCVALQGRVALGDDAGERFGCQLVVVLIGERPGLSFAGQPGGLPDLRAARRPDRRGKELRVEHPAGGAGVRSGGAADRLDCGGGGGEGGDGGGVEG